ncbi:MAG: LysR family transcriptional regulator [Solirubrobacterales bacterium]|nr:LysR family transcriptional regulator [Solirubrobacterales bacterium]
MSNPPRQPSEPLSSREIAVFVAAVDAGSIQGAAEAMHLTQSAATKRIQALERQLGTPLLERGRNGVRPTPAGRRLYPDAQRALAALAAGAEAAAGRSPSGTVKLAASRTAGGFVLPELLAGFRRDHPEYRPQVDVLNSPRVLELVRADEVGIGFVEGDDNLDELESTTVSRDEIVVAVASGHAWDGREEITAAELGRERYISREPGSGSRSVAENRLRRAGVDLVPSLELASLAGVKRALSDGGFTLISDLAVAAELRAGSLAALRITDIDLGRDISAVRRRNGNHDEPSRSFWRWLRRRTIFAGPGSPY